jgi:hypothetical protein
MASCSASGAPRFCSSASCALNRLYLRNRRCATQSNAARVFFSSRSVSSPTVQPFGGLAFIFSPKEERTTARIGRQNVLEAHRRGGRRSRERARAAIPRERRRYMAVSAGDDGGWMGARARSGYVSGRGGGALFQGEPTASSSSLLSSRGGVDRLDQKIARTRGA